MGPIKNELLEQASEIEGLFEGEAEPSHDGRRRRREVNRQRVVTALLDLFSEGHVWPTVANVAIRAGVSERSIFRYFDDSEDLAQAAIETRVKDGLPLALIPHPRPKPFERRLELLVASRADLFEYMMPVHRVTRAHATENAVFAESMKKVRNLLRLQLKGIIEQELEALGSQAAVVLSALDILFSFEAWYSFRVDQELSVRAAKEILRGSSIRLLLAK